MSSWPSRLLTETIIFYKPLMTPQTKQLSFSPEIPYLQAHFPLTTSAVSCDKAFPFLYVSSPPFLPVHCLVQVRYCSSGRPSDTVRQSMLSLCLPKSRPASSPAGFMCISFPSPFRRGTGSSHFCSCVPGLGILSVLALADHKIGNYL